MRKKGLSAIIGYVLLVSFAIIIGGLVYYWLQGYIPQDELECPDGVSIFVKDFKCTEDKKLKLTLENNGMFNIEGYFIRGTTNDEQEVATKDLSEYVDEGGRQGGIVRFERSEALEIDKNDTTTFDLSDVGEIYLIEIIPVRYETIENKKRVATCSDAKISEEVNCVN